mmetsp:Transcript_102008/g.141837  ORF Transcript_102008/g.141837 Transcript_102008/m.141837 type:complete len:233 (-) Transcript_102008:1345-2043(-)
MDEVEHAIVISIVSHLLVIKVVVVVVVVVVVIVGILVLVHVVICVLVLLENEIVVVVVVVVVGIDAVSGDIVIVIGESSRVTMLSFKFLALVDLAISKTQESVHVIKVTLRSSLAVDRLLLLVLLGLVIFKLVLDLGAAAVVVVIVGGVKHLRRGLAAIESLEGIHEVVGRGIVLIESSSQHVVARTSTIRNARLGLELEGVVVGSGVIVIANNVSSSDAAAVATLSTTIAD